MFLQALFFHRYSYIRKIDRWFTCKNYLSDDLLVALWRSPTDIVGVRFGPKTRYCLLDIDFNSPHHPRHSNNLRHILGALEDVGFISSVSLQSSESGGLHIYFFLSELVPTFGLATLLSSTLVNAGFEIKKGELEIFPNTKRYVKSSVTGQYSQYNGHRLPLQQGSFLLDSSYNVYSDSMESFDAAVRNSSENQDLDLILAGICFYKNNPSYRKTSSKNFSSVLNLWREDFNKVLNTGWTGHGQTNALLGTVSKYLVVFTDLSDDDQLSEMLKIVTGLSGYDKWCNHKHEIFDRCRSWLLCCRNYYYRYGSNSTKKSSVTFKKVFAPVLANVKTEELAEHRLKETLFGFRGEVFPSVSSLFRAIAAKSKSLFGKGFSNRTLYKYRGLWDSLVKPAVIPENLEVELSTAESFIKSESSEIFIQKPLPTPPFYNECFFNASALSSDSNQKLNLFSFSADRLAPGFFCKFLLHLLKSVQNLQLLAWVFLKDFSILVAKDDFAVAFEDAVFDIDVSDVSVNDGGINGIDISDVSLRYSGISGVDVSDINVNDSGISGVDVSDINVNDSGINGIDVSDINVNDSGINGIDVSDINVNDSGVNGIDVSDINLRYSRVNDIGVSDVNVNDISLNDSDINNVSVNDSGINGIDVSDINVNGISLNDISVNDSDVNDIDVSDIVLYDGDINEDGFFSFDCLL